MKKTITTGLVALALVTACTKKNGDKPAGLSNKELKIGITQEFENLNPMIMQMVATTYIHGCVGRSLINLDADGKWYPQMAKSIPTLENGGAKFINGKKKIAATWEILDGQKWGDGTPVTCEDFEFARIVANSPNVSVGEKEIYTDVDSVTWDKANPKKCVFTGKPKWDFAQTLVQFYPLPAHLERAVWEKYGKEKEGYEKNSNYVKNPTNPGLYNGPYVISDVQLGNYVTLSPNPHWDGEKPKIQKIVMKLIPDLGTLEANLRSGTIDMVSTLGFNLDQAVEFEKKVAAEHLPYDVVYTPSLTNEHIDLNMDNPILHDVRVRQAMLYAINREDLVKSLFAGKQPVALHFISPRDPWYTDDPTKVKVYKFDRKEAERLLDEAGWKKGADGIRTKDGKRMSLTFITTAGNKTRELVEVYLQEQWKQAGIEIVIRNEQARTFFAETTRKRKFDGLAMYAWIASPENNPRANYATKSIPSEKNGWSGQNYPGWSNPAVDKAVEAIDLEFNAAKRKELAISIEKAYMEDVPVLPLYYRADISVPPKSLKNYRPTGHQFYETNVVETWTLE